MAKKLSRSQSPVESSSIITAMTNRTKQTNGVDRMQRGDYSVVVGIPLPSLVLRYLIQSDVLPLGKIWHLAGEEGSCKSAFLYEMMRWHYLCDGGAALAQNENKDAADLRRSILQHNPIWRQKFVKEDTSSLEGWQDFVSSVMNSTRAEYEKRGATWPLIIGIDSLTATAPESVLENIDSEGHACRGFAIMANLISTYMKFIPGKVMDQPFTVVGTNHLKPSTNQQGLPQDLVPGGKSVKFMETYEFKMRRVSDIDKSKYTGVTIEFTAKKNSLGTSRRKATADMLWWMAPGPDNKPRQETAWDWETASVNLLLSFENAKGKKTMFKALQEVCDIKVISKTQKKAYSSELGVSKEEPVSFRSIGRKLEARPDLLEKLYPILGIAQRPVWNQETPFMEAVKAEYSRMEQETLDEIRRVASGELVLTTPTIPDDEED